MSLRAGLRCPDPSWSNARLWVNVLDHTRVLLGDPHLRSSDCLSVNGAAQVQADIQQKQCTTEYVLSLAHNVCHQ